MNFKKGLGEEAFEKLAALREDSAKVAQEGGYNGWKNYETWLVGLWMDNDEGTHDYWRERAQEIKEEGDFGGRGSNEFMPESVTPDDMLLSTIADELKDQHEMMVEEKGLEGFMADLINAALSEVDWRELAEHLLAE